MLPRLQAPCCRNSTSTMRYVRIIRHTDKTILLLRHQKPATHTDSGLYDSASRNTCASDRRQRALRVSQPYGLRFAYGVCVPTSRANAKLVTERGSTSSNDLAKLVTWNTKRAAGLFTVGERHVDPVAVGCSPSPPRGLQTST